MVKNNQQKFFFFNKKYLLYVSLILISLLLILLIIIFIKIVDELSDTSDNTEFYGKRFLWGLIKDDSATSDYSQVDCKRIEDFLERRKCYDKYGLEPYSRPLEECNEMEDVNEKRDCIDKYTYVTAVRIMNFSMCHNIKDEYIKNECYSDFAVSLNMGTYACDFIENDLDFKDRHTMRSCYGDLAVRKLNISLCDIYMGVEREFFELEECRARVKAYQTVFNGNISRCKESDVLEYYNLCLYGFFDRVDVKDCKTLGEYSQECYDYKSFSEAYANKNETFCDEISDKNFSKVCHNYFIDIEMMHYNTGDSDNDGLDDYNEVFMRLDPFDNDTDDDGLIDGFELKNEMNPSKIDTDGDGIDDYEEMVQIMMEDIGTLNRELIVDMIVDKGNERR